MDDPVQHLAALYRETAPALLAYFRHQPALAPHAEDLLQDTFVRAWREHSRVRASVTPRAYLFGIARYLSIDAVRSHRPTTDLPVDLIASNSPPEDSRLEPLRVAITALPKPHRETLLLKLQHDLSYAEIAEVLAIPVGTVRSRLHHAVAALRQTLNPPRHAT